MRVMIASGTPCRTRVPRQHAIFGGVFCSEAAMIRTYKYRLYPTKAQARALDFLLWQGRTLYNAALEQRITVYKETGKGVTYPQQWAHFRNLRNASPDTLGHINATSVQQMLRRLDKAFVAFFRRVKAGETPGFPRFKGRDRFHTTLIIGDKSMPRPTGKKGDEWGKFGEQSHTAKLTEADVLEIKRMLRDGVSRKDIAEKMGVSKTTISNISTGYRWSHVKLDS